MNREELKKQIVINFEKGEITEKERLINIMQCIDAHIEPKGTLLFHLKALTKQIEDSHCYGFEDVLEDYIKSNAL